MMPLDVNIAGPEDMPAIMPEAEGDLDEDFEEFEDFEDDFDDAEPDPDKLDEAPDALDEALELDLDDPDLDDLN